MDQTAKIATVETVRPEVERDWSRSLWTWVSWIALLSQQLRKLFL